MIHLFLHITLIAIFLMSCQKSEQSLSNDPYRFTNEKHLRNIRMLTTEGENAEAYFSFDQQKLIYQSRYGPYLCDQIFTMNIDGSDKKLVSTGYGRTTCSFFYPDDKRIIYASTHAADSACPPPPDFSHGYVWKIYSSFDLYTANIDGSNPVSLIPHAGYDAEATVSPQGDRIVFTSQRSGDLEIFSMNIDGTDLKQLTNTLGYDGGPFYSWDGKKIVYRAYHPKTEQQVQRYKELLENELIEPAQFQIWVMSADGKNKRQVTDNEFANFAPFYHPDNKRIIFCSNLNSKDPRRPDFNLWMMNEDGSGIEQITYFDSFDGFPMFSANGEQLVFASNRFNQQPRDTNVFISDWID